MIRAAMSAVGLVVTLVGFGWLAGISAAAAWWTFLAGWNVIW